MADAAASLPQGWGSGRLADGLVYYFHASNRHAITFEPPAHTPGTRDQRVARATHTFDARAGAQLAEGDIVFQAGDMIKLVSDAPGQGWLTGQVLGAGDGPVGTFPANFVEVVARESEVERERPRSPDPGEEPGEERPRTPDPGEGRPRTPDPGEAPAAAAPGAPEGAEGGGDDEGGAAAAAAPSHYFDEAIGQWRMDAALEQRLEAEQAEEDHYRAVFRDCANQVARKRRIYDEGVKARFRGISALAQGMEQMGGPSRWTKEGVADARWGSVAAAAQKSPRGAAAAEGGAEGLLGREAGRQRRREREAAEAQGELQVGMTVELHSITSAARRALNGCRGEVREEMATDVSSHTSAGARPYQNLLKSDAVACRGGGWWMWSSRTARGSRSVCAPRRCGASPRCAWGTPRWSQGSRRRTLAMGRTGLSRRTTTCRGCSCWRCRAAALRRRVTRRARGVRQRRAGGSSRATSAA